MPLMATEKTHTHQSNVGNQYRVMTSRERQKRLSSTGPHRTVIPVMENSSSGIHQARSDQVTCYPLRHMQTSFVSLFKRSSSLPAVCDETQESTGHITSALFTPNLLSSPCFFSGSKMIIHEMSPSNNNTPVKNIYRRPTSRTVNLSSVNHCHLNVNDHKFRTNFVPPASSPQSRSANPNLSRLSSQNTKLLGDNQRYTTRYCSLSTNVGSDQGEFQRCRTKSLPFLPNPILKRHDTPSLTTGNSTSCKTPIRRACFRQEVDVCYFDTKDRPRTTRSVPGDAQRISFGAYVVNDDKEQKELSRTLETLSNNMLDNRISTVVIPPNGPDLCQTSQLDATKGIACSTNAKYIPCVDGKGNKGKLLRLDVRPNAKCVRERTLVKALSGGGAVIIHLFQNEVEDGGSAVLRQHVKKLALPVNVDPYRVRAHVHKDGVLTIEAPVVDSSLPKI